MVLEAIEEHDLQIVGVRPRVMVEQSPQEAQVAQCVGRITDASKNILATGRLMGWTVEPDWKAKEVRLVSAGSAGTYSVARVTPEGMPIFIPEHIRTVFGLDLQQFEREYVAARRR